MSNLLPAKAHLIFATSMHDNDGRKTREMSDRSQDLSHHRLAVFHEVYRASVVSRCTVKHIVATSSNANGGIIAGASIKNDRSPDD